MCKKIMHKLLKVILNNFYYTLYARFCETVGVSTDYSGDFFQFLT